MLIVTTDVDPHRRFSVHMHTYMHAYVADRCQACVRSHDDLGQCEEEQKSYMRCKRNVVLGHGLGDQGASFKATAAAVSESRNRLNAAQADAVAAAQRQNQTLSAEQMEALGLKACAVQRAEAAAAAGAAQGGTQSAKQQFPAMPAMPKFPTPVKPQVPQYVPEGGMCPRNGGIIGPKFPIPKIKWAPFWPFGFQWHWMAGLIIMCIVNGFLPQGIFELIVKVYIAMMQIMPPILNLALNLG